MPGFEIFGEEEKKEVQDVLNTGVLFRYGFDQARQGHWKARSFEKLLADRLGIGYCHLCSSGTAALGIALAACGVGAGDEVIVPPFTFIATVEAVLAAGAVPVFGEIDTTLCLDPDRLDPLLTSRTRAVLPVHMCGATARIDEIKAFCDRKGLVLIEDACQALGATFGGQAAGTFGHMGCFSFDAVKTITCGEGGAVATGDKGRYDTAQAFADHGHDHIGSDRGLEGHPILGVNYRISELNAAVGLAQLRKLEQILDQQRKTKAAVKDALAAVKGIGFRTLPDADGDSATFISFLLDDQAACRRFAQNLKEEGVDGCFYWYENNWHYFRNWQHLKQLAAPARLPLALYPHCPDYRGTRLPQSDAVMARTLSMLIKLTWTPAQLEDRIRRMTRAAQGI